MIVTGVLQNGPAAQAGIRPGDVMVAIAGKPVANVSEMLSAVAALKPGAAARFSLQRRNLKGGTKPLEGWGFRNETDPLTDVLLGSPAHLRHLSTSSLSRKHLREAPCNVQVAQAQRFG